MPPKKIVTKQQILKAALDITRESGIDAVTARSVAASLEISTHPLFSFYSTIAELKNDVLAEAREIYRTYTLNGLKEDIPFLGVGHQFLNLAKTEPELFKLLFLRESDGSTNTVMEAYEFTLDLVVDSVMKIYNVDKPTAKNYYKSLWLMSYAFTTLIVTGNCPYSDKEMSDTMTQISLSLCKAYKEIPGFLTNDFDKDKLFTELVKK